jgi:hypothetical protein
VALRETKVKMVRLKQRLATMESNTEGSGDKVRGWMDTSGVSSGTSADNPDS